MEPEGQTKWTQAVMVTADPRLVLREQELDGGLELLLLAEAALWAQIDAGLEEGGLGLGRSHWRAAFLLRRRPGVGVQELAHLTSLSKQAASRIVAELEAKGLAEKISGELDARRRTARLTPAGEQAAPIAPAAWTASAERGRSWRPWPADACAAEDR
jgi:DNA-binding MarR family transcriptional regulator